MHDRDERDRQASPNGMVLRNVEDLVALAKSPDHSAVRVQMVVPAEIQELDSIRQLRQIVLDTTAEHATYRSGT